METLHFLHFPAWTAHRIDMTGVKHLTIWFSPWFRTWTLNLFLDIVCFLFHLICCCWQLLWALVCRQPGHPKSFSASIDSIVKLFFRETGKLDFLPCTKCGLLSAWWTLGILYSKVFHWWPRSKDRHFTPRALLSGFRRYRVLKLKFFLSGQLARPSSLQHFH